MSFAYSKKILASLLAAALLLLPVPALAVDITGNLVVEVKTASDEKPMVGVKVEVRDEADTRAPISKTTDSTGRAAFDNLQIGSYKIEVSQTGYESDRAIVQVTAGASYDYKSLLDVKGGEKVIKVHETVNQVNPNDPYQETTRRDSNFIQNQIAGGDSLQNVLSTYPGVNTDSLGQVHVRGEHKSISLSIDGVAIPMPTESVVSQLIDPRFVDTLEVRTGGFDASYGGQLGAMFNIVTKTGPQTPYAEFLPSFGDNGQSGELIRAGGSNAQGTFNYFVGAVNTTTDLFTEAPNPNSQNNNNTDQQQNYIIRMTQKYDRDTLGLTLDSTNGVFGVAENPQDFVAGVRQFEQDTNSLAAFSWKHQLDDRTDMLFGLSYLKATSAYTNNGAFTPFIISPNAALETAAVGTLGFALPSNPENPGSPYLPTTNLDVEQTQPSIEVTRHLTEDNEIKMGVTYDNIFSAQSVTVAMPGATAGGLSLAQVVANGLLPPGANTTLVNGVPTFSSSLARVGEEESAYFSQTFKASKKLVINYGLRADQYNDGVGGAQNVTQNQLSPILNTSYLVSDTAALRFSYNRLFQAPPLELDTSGNSVVVPQRTSAYELSYEWQPRKYMVANVAAVYKDYTNQVDVALLIPGSNLPVFAPVNFDHGFYKGIDAGITTRYPTGYNYFLSTTYSQASPTIAGPFDPILPAFNDHDQRVQATGGLSYTNTLGGVAAFNFLYGSGYALDGVAIYNSFGIAPFGLVGDRIPRFVANLSYNYVPKGVDGKPLKDRAFGIQAQNIFNNTEVVNFANGFAGDRFLQGRRVVATGRFKFNLNR